MASEYATILSQIPLGDMVVQYLLATESQSVGLRLVPAVLVEKIVTRREYLQTHEIQLLPKPTPQIRAWEIDPLVQVKLTGDATRGFSQGITLRNSETLSSLRYAGQEMHTSEGRIEVITTLRSDRGYACIHHLSYRDGDTSLTVHTEFLNESQKSFCLELLASFSLSGLSPFVVDDASNRLYLHRFRTFWSAEARHVCESIESLHLERSWAGHGVRAERFGQVGSMPTRGYFPFIGTEDRIEGVFWGAQLAWAGSWQMEAYRRDDQLSISGGLADHEFGHWKKTIAPGESFSSPPAYLTTVKGTLDDLCYRLTQMHIQAAEQTPASERTLPVLFNEYCTTWGNPYQEKLLSIAQFLKGSGVKYLVIDAGWYKQKGTSWATFQGEWIPSSDLFPQGIATMAALIREQGFIPGIWLEFEVVGNQSPLFESKIEHFLHRDGFPITAGERRFWDFRDPWVHQYLRERVFGLLREAGFGYIKVDYNDTVGIGVDGHESQGEELREHIIAVQNFFREMRHEFPDLVIEVCASGGHRLEPSMLALASMGSFSDAHESLEIPIIAGNLHRLILPRQSQIWAVLHAADSMQRLAYSLSAGFLGRLCLSGEIDSLSEDQRALVYSAINFYGLIAPIIKSGKSYLYQVIGPAWRHPQGSQALVRISERRDEAVVIVHTFAAPLPDEIVVSLPDGDWQVAHTFPNISPVPEISNSCLRIKPIREFDGMALHLILRMALY